MRSFTRKKKGMTLIELVVVIVVAAVIMTGLITVFIPTINFLFYFPRTIMAQNAGADLMQIIIAGDHFARGLRFTGQACLLPTGGASTITSATSLALTYNYADPSQCIMSGGLNDHTVVLTYSAANQTVTRNIDGGGARIIPDYVVAAGDLNYDELENENVGAPSLAFFRYWDSAGTEIDGSVPANIYRVDIAFRVLTGSGNIKHTAASVYMKAGVEIKRYTT